MYTPIYTFKTSMIHTHSCDHVLTNARTYARTHAHTQMRSYSRVDNYRCGCGICLHIIV